MPAAAPAAAKLVCPQCRAEHPANCGEKIFVNIECSVCMGDCTPSVMLPCKHAVYCVECYTGLQGQDAAALDAKRRKVDDIEVAEIPHLWLAVDVGTTGKKELRRVSLEAAATGYTTEVRCEVAVGTRDKIVSDGLGGVYVLSEGASAGKSAAAAAARAPMLRHITSTDPRDVKDIPTSVSDFAGAQLVAGAPGMLWLLGKTDKKFERDPDHKVRLFQYRDDAEAQHSVLLAPFNIDQALARTLLAPDGRGGVMGMCVDKCAVMRSTDSYMNHFGANGYVQLLHLPAHQQSGLANFGLANHSRGQVVAFLGVKSANNPEAAGLTIARGHGPCGGAYVHGYYQSDCGAKGATKRWQISHYYRRHEGEAADGAGLAALFVKADTHYDYLKQSLPLSSTLTI